MTPYDRHPALADRVIHAFSTRHRLAYAELDPALTIRRASDNFAALLHEEGAPEGRPLTEVLWEFVGSEALLEEVLAGEQPSFEIERVNREGADGELRYLDFRVLPIDGERPEAGLLLTVEDSTEGRRLEQRLVQDRNELLLLQRQLAETNDALERLSRFKSFLLSMAAHDLRSSIAAVSGYAELLLEERDFLAEEEQVEFIGIIRSQAYQLGRLLSSLLDLDQIEHGRLVIDHEPCDLNALAFEVIETLRPAAQLQQVSLALELPETPLRVQGDSGRILQILHNLANNAIKYTPSGGAVRCVVAPTEGGARVEVHDTGYGMSEEQREQLFQLYYRTDDARRSKIHGTGLGLFIVKTLVEAHHGQIEVESTPGEGSTFTLFLPATPPAPPPDDADDEEA